MSAYVYYPMHHHRYYYQHLIVINVTLAFNITKKKEKRERQKFNRSPRAEPRRNARDRREAGMSSA